MEKHLRRHKEKLAACFRRLRSASPKAASRGQSTALTPEASSNTDSLDPAAKFKEPDSATDDDVPSSVDVLPKASTVSVTAQVIGPGIYDPLSWWTRAFISLQADEDAQSVLMSYSRLVLTYNSSAAGTNETEDVITTALLAPPGAWRQTLNERAAAARDSISQQGTIAKSAIRIVSMINAAEAVITLATSFEPHAALAWSGISAILPVSWLQNPTVFRDLLSSVAHECFGAERRSHGRTRIYHNPADKISVIRRYLPLISHG